MNRRTRRALLVALEGIDGSGKSSLQRELARRLRRHGWKVGLWKEPTDRRLGARAQAAGRLDPWNAAMYFTLDRMQARPKLESLLSRNDLVLSDRSFYSTLAYQGSSLPPAQREVLDHLQSQATVAPDRVLWLEIPVAEALRRVRRRGARTAPLERKRTLTRVARAYSSLARSSRWATLESRRPTREIFVLAERQVVAWLGQGRRAQTKRRSQSS